MGWWWRRASRRGVKPSRGLQAAAPAGSAAHAGLASPMEGGQAGNAGVGTWLEVVASAVKVPLSLRSIAAACCWVALLAVGQSVATCVLGTMVSV